ncbi:hypothetical protein A223 [Sulfolobus turreted icosahedral virus 1]|uniref:A223 penton protein C-terminal domain-containing protein n=1 Tax=Sulfolobus turreted icosahedral virus 1 TaxID=269145 RepID=Q6Q0L4_9VIRU|nr:hypothetical protein A223 [Sulfolobus turreted icosahedral virus 1]AAS89077.1 hypothetical protein A223 [Sulfolobus turreted icosahedral virus 1]3J31_Q Chain Q, A223 penton base [Sulfolobus turreted icosahedral virus 1]
MGEVFKEVKEKFERYKFDVVYVDREYPVSSNNLNVFFEIGERNSFSGLLINEGQAVIDVLLLKKSHEGLSPIPGEGTGIQLSAGQILKFYNVPIAEIIVEYDPSNVSGVSSNVKLKGTIHPLFEVPSQISIENFQPTENYLIYSGFGTSLPQTYTIPANGYLIISITNTSTGNIGQITLTIGSTTMTFNLQTGENKIPVIAGTQITNLTLTSSSAILIYEEVI